MRSVVALFLVAIAAVPALGQPLLPGAIAGRVVDQSGLPLAGVLVTIKNSGTGTVRQLLTGPDGMYQAGPVPSGEYTVSFELAGFRPQRHEVRVGTTGAVTLNVELPLAAFPAAVTVTTDTFRDEPDLTLPDAAVFPASSLDLLPIRASDTARITMAPGVTANGPNNALTMSGGLSYGNLFLLDGFVINENLRGQARPFLIQEALQETRVAVSGIPAEYGRLQGGVVNTVTKSGSNTFSGSIRTTFSNDRWRALTPFQGDQTVNRRLPAFQATLGGPVLRKRLWFFAAGEFDQIKQNRTMPYTLVNYTASQQHQRFEGKLTLATSRGQTARLAYYRLDTRQSHASTGVVMDLASLYDSASPESLLGATYTATLGQRLALEGQYSSRQLTFGDVGSRDTTLAGGTPVWDRSRSDARFHSPAGCAVCSGSADERDNQNLSAKVFYTVAASSVGAHEITAGVDWFRESRRNNSYQSGSGFRVRATRSTIVGAEIFPVFLSDRTTWIYWTPILDDARGNDLRTTSIVVADTWRIGRGVTVKAGLRYDDNRDRDSLGASVVRDGEVSPRVGVVWDARGDGRLQLRAGVARYVTSITSNIADAASSGGRPATYVYDYLGPAVNASPGAAQLTSEKALQILFDWFAANGGTSRATRSAPSIPGLTVRIDPNIRPPDAREVTVGVTWAIGQAGSVRVDGIYRSFGSFYANRRDLPTGRVTGDSGRQYDLLVVGNTERVTRTYQGLNAQGSFRIASRARVWAAYTLAWARGNYDGESTTVGPDASAYTDYPEYRDPRWNSPVGWLSVDQRHKVRVTATFDLPVPSSAGRLTPGIIQRLDSGRPWSAVGNINPTAYVPNPGYVTPPTSVAYYFSARGAFRTDTAVATDVTLTWARRLPRTRTAQLVIRAYVTNVFNQAAIIDVARTVLTRNDSTTYKAFNPFAEQPVIGVHYGYGTHYGKPTTPGDYQPPRELTLSVAVRF